MNFFGSFFVANVAGDGCEDDVNVKELQLTQQILDEKEERKRERYPMKREYPENTLCIYL